MTRIAVIGGGAAGSVVVGELLRQHRDTPISVHWFAGTRDPGRGVAYATRADHHLLNVRTAGMGMFADDMGAFLRYAETRGFDVGGADFVPRAWFGDFIETTLDGLVTEARQRGLAIRILKEEAVTVRGSDELGFVVSSRSGEDFHLDSVVLAIGALPPDPLPGADPEALCSGAYALDPWHWPGSAADPAHVVVVGTGLTGADMILEIASIWPQAQVTAISRRGRLPETHLAEPGLPYEHQAELIEAMLANPSVRRWTRLLGEAASDESVDWRALLDGLRPATTRLWRSLPITERARFLRHLRPLWEARRHRLPPQTAQALDALRAEGRLTIRAGRMAGIEGRGPLGVRVSNASGAEETLVADRVIQATGLNTAVAETRHRLVRQMLDEGIVRADPLGLGLAADDDGYLLRPDGSRTTKLRAIGTLLRGSFWECTALAEIRALARSTASDILAMAAPRQSPGRLRTFVPTRRLTLPT